MRVFLYRNFDATLMSTASVLRGVGNKVYEHAFPIYRPLYAAYKAFTDRAERELLRQVLFPGTVVVDAGANIGIYSEFLSRCVGPKGVVHSFEPSPDNFKRLRAVTRKLSNVRLFQGAVGEHSGNSQLYLSNKLNVDHRAYMAMADADSRHTVPIEMVALDDYFKPGERVDLIKMDIQGYELHALRGANRVLVDNPDIKVLLEFWPYGLKQAGANRVDLIAALEEKGMVIRQVSSEGLIPFRSDSASESADWYVNLFASRT
jgi:FkbM family methyltransferase